MRAHQLSGHCCLLLQMKNIQGNDQSDDCETVTDTEQ